MKRLRRQTYKRAKKERLGELSGVKAIGDGVSGLRVSVNISGHSGCPSRGGHQLLRVSTTKGGQEALVQRRQRLSLRGFCHRPDTARPKGWPVTLFLARTQGCRGQYEGHHHEERLPGVGSELEQEGEGAEDGDATIDYEDDDEVRTETWSAWMAEISEEWAAPENSLEVTL